MSEIVIPEIETVQAATRRVFEGKIDDKELDHFLNVTTGRNSAQSPAGLVAALPAARSIKTPDPVTAKGSTYFGGFFGVVSCEPGHLPYKFEEKAWGIGVVAVAAGGLLYTAYASWEAFFSETVAYHAQGIAKAGGILQITFLNKRHLPIGQFDGVAGGIGAFECGGSGKWTKK